MMAMKTVCTASVLAPLVGAAIFFAPAAYAQTQTKTSQSNTGNVIFIHPDGSGMAHWHALRLVDKGPDGMLHWDRLERMALYRGHLANSAVSSSNGGATVHAYGIKALYEDYGLTDATPRVSLSGKKRSILEEAKGAGLATVIINSGHIAEPGSGVFASEAESRRMTDTITLQIIESGTDIILSGGEVLLLPEGKAGHFGEKGVRKDGRNLIELAKKNGYRVVYTKQELKALPDTVSKVLGVFAAFNTFHDQPEEALAEKKLPLYVASAPTVAEMGAEALRILAKKNKRFLMVLEEEGSDNFANKNNAPGTLEALRRADAAIGVAMEFVRDGKTLLLTAADSDAGGLAIHAIRDSSVIAQGLPDALSNGAPLDGVSGTGSKPFLSAPDAQGRRHAFGIAWAGYEDFGGGVVARAHGLNADRLPQTTDNTDIYRMMYLTLFGKWLER